MQLNDAGKIVEEEWLKTAEKRYEIELDLWVVMPNHFHGIILIDDHRRGTTCRAQSTPERFGKPVTGSIPTIMRAFKSASARRVNQLRRTPGESLWQRNYWEHVIRNQQELDMIREYIQNNPIRWLQDKLYVVGQNRQGAVLDS